MTQDVVIPIDFGQGVDTKTDPKLVMATKFQLLKDGIFTKTKQTRKRNGYDNLTLNQVGGGAITSPKMVQAYKNELVCAALNSSGTPCLFSYSRSLAGWSSLGEYSSVSVQKTVIDAPVLNQTQAAGIQPDSSSNCSGVVSGNIALYAYDNPSGSYGEDATAGVYMTVVDNSTGQHLCDQTFVALGAFSKAALIGPSTFAIFYVLHSGVTTVLYGVVITVSLSGGVTVGTPAVIGGCRAKSNLSDRFAYCFDYVTTATGIIIASAFNGTVGLYSLDTTLAPLNTATITASGNTTPVNATLDAAGNVWVYWVQAGTTLKYAVYSSTLSLVLANTTITTTGALAPFGQITSRNTGSGTQTLYLSNYATFGATENVNVLQPYIRSVDLDISGIVGSVRLVTSGVDIYAKPFTAQGISYLPCVSFSQSQSTGVIIDISNSGTTGLASGQTYAAAKFLPNEAEGLYSCGYGTTGGTIVGTQFTGNRFPGYLNVVQTLSSTRFLLAAGFITSVNEVIVAPAGPSAFPTGGVANVAQMGVASILFDFDHIDAYQALIQQDTLVMNGGAMGMYDTAYYSELGFTIPPDNVSALVAVGSSNIGSGTYIYYVTQSWNDALGNVHESAPSPGITVVIPSGGTTYTVALTLPTLGVTQKLNVQFNFWRSDSNLGGNIAYFMGSVHNSPTSLAATFTDGTPGSTVGTRSLYTQSGAILENIAPPPAMVMWTNNNRLWVIDSENPETTIEYSKTSSRGTGISFSTGLLEFVVDSKGGAITGASPMDEKTVLLKESGLGFFVGDGANDSGTGSTLSAFQFVPSDVGCTNSKSVILYPGGIIFRSLKGIYEVNRGTQVSYFGMPVEAYNSQDIRAALIVSDRNQIRFLTSSGYSLLFDYVMNQWSVFTNHTGYSECSWGGVYVYARTDGKIYTENTTRFLDDTASFAPALQTAWMNLASVQSFQRVKELLPLGDYQNGSSSGHGLLIQAAYDFSPTFGTGVPYYFGAASTSGVFQYRNFFAQQKCDTLSLLITEITTGASGEFIDLTNMSFLAGLKKGTNKLSPARSVG